MDRRLPPATRTLSLREDREQRLAFHHEQTGPTPTVRSIMHLELAGSQNPDCSRMDTRDGA